MATAGESFKAEFLARFETDSLTDLALLDMACLALDEATDLAAQIRSDGFMVLGSTKQPTANPLLRELRAHRNSFADLARQLEPGQRGTTTSAAGTALAAKRWSTT
jgi:hypothetical protein